MTIKDWLYLAITVASYAIAIIAGVYTHNKQKINRATKSGQIMDTLGKLATYAVHEAEYTGMENADKREYASEVIEQGLKWFGINDVTPALINGAIEKAVNIAKNVSDTIGGINASYTYGGNTYALNSEFTKELIGSYIFQNWNTKQDGTGFTYIDGDAYFVHSDITLYAQWK